MVKGKGRQAHDLAVKSIFNEETELFLRKDM
jgi:hypothetical protein